MQIKNVRFLIAALTTLSAFAVYVSRVNLSIAIIAMVDEATLNATSFPANTSDKVVQSLAALDVVAAPLPVANLTTGRPHTRHRMSLDSMAKVANNAQQLIANEPHPAPLSNYFPVSKEAVKAPLITQEKFDWDKREQGHILGAFFYGYILLQIPGARLAERVGARWILLASTAGSALISLIFPLSTQLNSIYLLMLLRFVMGLCQSAFFPAAYVFYCRWLPEHERAVLLPVMFIGSNMGSISTYIMSSYLMSSTYGWPSVFYVSGLICLLVSAFWAMVASNGPEDNWLITDQERDYILTEINNQRDDSSPKVGARSASSTVAGCCKPTSANLNHQQQQQQQQQSVRQPKEVLKLNQLNSKLVSDQLKPKQIANIKQLHSKLNKSKSANDLIPRETAARLLEQQQEVLKAASKGALVLGSISANSSGAAGGGSSGSRVEPLKLRQMSWFKMVRSVPVWVLVLAMYGNEWSQVVLTYELPTYLNRALKLPIEQNGAINSFFQLSYTLASPVVSSLGACILERHVFGMRKIHVRKLFQSFATFGQMICFISVPICGPNKGLIIMFMFAAIVFKSCANAGDIMIPGDLSPEFAGTIFSFANTIGNTAGIIVPYLAALIVSDFDQRDHWTPFWLTSATIMGSSGLIFILLGKTNRQDFSVEQDFVGSQECGGAPVDHHHHHHHSRRDSDPKKRAQESDRRQPPPRL